MISEMTVYCRDSLKMNVLREVLAGEMTLTFRMDGERAEDYASSLHREDSRMRVYGKFNLSEDPTGEVLTVRPVAAQAGLRIDIACGTECAGKTLTLVRGATKTVEQTWELGGLQRIALIPSGDGFTLRLTCRDISTAAASSEAHSSEANSTETASSETASSEADSSEAHSSETASSEANSTGATSSETASTNTASAGTDFPGWVSPEDDFWESDFPGAESIPVPAASASPQEQPPQSEEEKRRVIAAETEKDQTVFQAELEELAACVEADAEVLAYYRDKDIRPTEDLLRDIREKIAQAETQIRLLIEAKQRKTAAIEAEIKHQKSGSHE